MHRTISADLEAAPSIVYRRLAELDGYGDWMGLVSRVEHADAHDADAGPAWWVTLRASIGPLARSKRLRMVRTRADEPTSLRFERVEIDGRRHSPWVLDVAIRGATSHAPSPSDGTTSENTAGSVVDVTLSYDGGLWDPLLDRVLGSQIDNAVPRLAALVAPAR